jgi:hypothetical protein
MGNSPEAELKKMSDALSIFGGSNKGFMELYKKSKSKQYDFLYLSIDYMSAFQNFDKLLWSQDDQYNNDNNDNEIKNEK